MVTFYAQNRFSLVTDVTIFMLMKNYFYLFLLFLSSCSSNQEQKITEDPAFILLQNIQKSNYSKRIEAGFKNIDASCGGLDKQHYLICKEYDSLKNIYQEYGVSEYGQKYRIVDSIVDGKIIDSKRFYYGFENIGNSPNLTILNQMPISKNTLFEEIIYDYDTENNLRKIMYYTRAEKAKYLSLSDTNYNNCERESLPSVKTEYLGNYMKNFDSMYLYQIAIFKKDTFLNEERNMKYVFSKDSVEMNKLNLTSLSIYPITNIDKKTNLSQDIDFGKDTLSNGSFDYHHFKTPIDSLKHQTISIDSCPLEYNLKTEKIKYGKSVWIIFD
ncbi:hypothetical protein V9L05_02165 [Bernardetia sp. Wsw4-3y2]|uniref:hypothetical protein n=1 Tax=Bernardetia sp. Wsw4-3y2 TaxID=3127471 RepID=UPI0030D018B3